PGAIAVASVGCGADSNPNSGVTGDKVELSKAQGQEIAAEVKRLLAGKLKPITVAPGTKYSRVKIAFDTPRTRAEWEDRAKLQDAVGHHARVTLAKLDRGESLPEEMDYPVQSWVFGNELAIVFLPGETVVDYSLRLKRQYDKTRLWVNGYSNEGRCYLPSERILTEGGYEGGGAMIYYDFPNRFAPGLEDKMIGAVASQIPDSFKAPPGTEGTKPLEPEEALRSFHTKPAQVVELVAAEPLVQDPVAIDWGPDGKLWVCEMHDYPSGVDNNWQPGGRVKWLEDRDGDGRYERAVVFAEDLPFPTGIMAWNGGVLICAAPDILFARDEDGDGKADKIEKVFTGFPTDNFQARVNSLSLGLDNWIYAANGLLGGKISQQRSSLWPASQSQPVDIRGRDFRISPSTGALETVSGLTQQGRTRDDWGNWFGCDNTRLLLHYPWSERYMRRNPHVAAPDSIKLTTQGAEGSRVFPTSPLMERFNDPEFANRTTSACGIGVYRDTLLGEDYYGNVYTCEPVHNLVHREVLSGDLVLSSGRAPDESGSEFFSSTDNWFRPVQARTGPDGALYVVDMYRFLIEHPRWIPVERLAKIDIRAGADRGRIYRLRPKAGELRPIRDLTKLALDDLAAALNSPNGTERDRVHAELLHRRDASARLPLENLVREADLPQVRLQAL
ncbi:MAG TPA: PVC-type heme-binding CxxCH protein, partial [Candidatus Kapabacteria bacterium]|nr:PVC-type heme-binding CxxCH protein [Candidatus Kapabacteria bacterium]